MEVLGLGTWGTWGLGNVLTICVVQRVTKFIVFFFFFFYGGGSDWLWIFLFASHYFTLPDVVEFLFLFFSCLFHDTTNGGVYI